VNTESDDSKIAAERARASSIDPAVESAQSDTSLTIASRLLALAEGLYLLRVSAGYTAAQGLSGIHFSVPRLADGSANEAIVRDLPTEESLSGGLAVAKVGSPGGAILVNAYGLASDFASKFTIDVQRLNRSSASLSPGSTRDVATEITVSIERHGLRRFAGTGWAGSRSRQLSIYALAIETKDPQKALIEVKAFGADARQSDWVSGGRICGPFPKNRPLMGFAARIPTPADQQFTIAYHGWFASAGMIGPRSGGEPCLSPMLGDPLTAIAVRVYEHPSH